MGNYTNQQVRDYQSYVRRQQQGEASTMLFLHLSKLDVASQEKFVRGLSPAMMALYGFRPAHFQKRFFDANGCFVPVDIAEPPPDPGSGARGGYLSRAFAAMLCRFLCHFLHSSRREKH